MADKAQTMGDFPAPPRAAKPGGGPDGDLAAHADRSLSLRSAGPETRKGSSPQRGSSPPGLSKRATSGPDPGPLIERMQQLFDNLYDKDTNPEGIISMGVAENSLMSDWCLDVFVKAFAHNFSKKDLTYGDHPWASKRLVGTLTRFVNDYFHPVVPVEPKHFIVGNGASALLDQLFYTLADEGDAVLVSAPYYNGFDMDLVHRDRLHIEQVHHSDAFAKSALDDYRAAHDRLTQSGKKVKAVLLCNPQNPLGRCYSRETLLEFGRFCEENNLHLVSDEIYATSIYENDDYPDALPFTSVLAIDFAKELGAAFDSSRVHVVYGMSKDFCANGLRGSCMISQHNQTLIKTMGLLAFFMKISSPADCIWSYILDDRSVLEDFLAENQKRLGEACARVRAFFRERDVQVLPCNAGHFMMVNLGKRLGFDNFETEAKVYDKLFKAGIYIPPGAAYHNGTAGWFRVTFCIEPESLDVAFERIDKALDLTPQ